MTTWPSGRGRHGLALVLTVIAVTLAAGCGSSGTAASHDTAAPQPAYTPVYAPTPTYKTANGLPPGVLAEIKLEQESAPVGLVVGDGSVWVTTHRSTDVYRIDPTRDKIVATIDVGHESCGRPLIAGKELWVPSCDAGVKTSVIDTSTDQVVASVSPYPIAYVNGAVWGSAANGKLAKLSTTTFTTESTLAALGDDAAYDGHLLWADQLDENGDYLGRLTVVDPVTNRVVKVLHTRKLAAGAYITYAYGSIWLKGGSPTMLRINPRTYAVTSYRIPHDHEFSQFGDVWIAPGAGSLWIRTSDTTFARIDPRTVTVTHVYHGDENGDGGFPLVAFGSLWTANFGSDSVWRLRITS